MQIFGPFRVNTTTNTQPSNSVSPKSNDSPINRVSGQPIDQLDLSDAASGVNRLDQVEAPVVEGIRFERVAEIRRQIAEGSYDTDAKLDAALDNLLDEIG